MQTEIMSVDSPNAISHAVDVLKHCGLVAFPTDTVYGIAAYPFNVECIERLYGAKGRNSQKAIAILVGDISQLDKVAVSLSQTATRLAKRFWPGPLTLIVPRHPSLPRILAPDPTIGVRMPDHPVALALLQQVGPLAVTSANISGQNNTTTAKEVMAQLRGRVHLVLDGGVSPGGVPSTVVDCIKVEPAVLRTGPISLEAIRAALIGS